MQSVGHIQWKLYLNSAVSGTHAFETVLEQCGLWTHTQWKHYLNNAVFVTHSGNDT